MRLVVSGDYKRARDPTCAAFEVVPCDVFITEATFGLPVFRIPTRRVEVRKLLESRAAVSGARPHRRRLCARQGAAGMMLLREAGYDRPIHLHGAMEKLTAFTSARLPAGRHAEGGGRRPRRA